PRTHATWLATRPEQAELAACARLGRLLARWPLRVHVVHAACGGVPAWARAQRARGAAVTVETCPHYLAFAADGIADGATAFKCAPPIRDAAAREALWEALRDGGLDLVASDHSPCPPALRQPERGDFLAAWGGIASLELGLAAVWTQARRRGFTPADLARWMSAAPAALAGLAGVKGAIAPGADADLVAFDPAAEWVVDAAALQQRHPLTPYAGRTLAGRVRATWLAGRRVWDGARVAGPHGRPLLRGVERPAPLG
ncbi:MAG TPA: amidohydrolase family protein, partial [Candidatus Eisenbacteria bacterium]|nr:amidohydrolase family protein [Candidatus Eisenbacteria bacterium]